MSSSSSQAFLLVDGYNMIGSWPELKQARDRDGLEAARYALIEALVNYSAVEGSQTEVIFDAHYQQTPGYRETYSPHLSAYFTNFAQTADTYIEKTCAAFFRQNSARVSRMIVATSDRAQQLTVIGYGAELMSAQQLAGAVEQTTRKTQRHSRPHQKPRGRFLFNSLDPKAQQRLAQWRLGLR